jgi:hypothetical protein
MIKQRIKKKVVLVRICYRMSIYETKDNPLLRHTMGFTSFLKAAVPVELFPE